MLLLPTPSKEAGLLALGRIISRFLERYPRCPLLLRPGIREIDQLPPAVPPGQEVNHEHI